MSWSEPGFGFFGKGFWARRVLWDNVPVQHRTLDTEGRLEQLLGAYGDELEAFLAAISQLPLQRDPHLARATTGEGEWFYVTALEAWTDAAWGPVARLRGEADVTAMPPTRLTLAAEGYVACVPGDVGLPVVGADTGSVGTLLTYDNVARTWDVSRTETGDAFDEAEQVAVQGGAGAGQVTGLAPDGYPWWPYRPISNVARWWTVSIPAVDDATGAEDPAAYEVALVRTRNCDPAAQYGAARSRANEVWVRGGDLVLPFQYPAGWILTGNGDTDAGAFGSGVPIGLGDGTTAPLVALPGPQQRLQPNVDDPAGAPPWPIAGARLVVDVPLQGGGQVRLYDLPDAGTTELGTLYRADPMALTTLDLVNPLGTVDYLAGLVTIDLAPLGWFSLFDGPITAHWQALGYYLPFQPPRTLDHLARDYGFNNDRNDPEERQRAAIAHLWQYFGCKGAQDAYRIRGEISLFDVFVRGLWRLCSADLALSLPADHVWEYNSTYYTDLEPRSVRFDDIRGDEQYYDTFNHDPLFPSPAWLTLADRARIYEDAGAGDGMSVGLAFALDVTQGYYGQVSELDALARTPAVIIAADALTTAEAAALNLPAGYRVTVEMMRCQAEAFHFSKGYFGLTEYVHGVAPPAIADQVYWIDAEESAWNVTAAVPGFPDRDVGRWTVIIGTGVGGAVPAPGAHVAVRYWPGIDLGDCCYCRSYRVRVEIEPTAEAYTYYETDAAMQAAISRLQQKIADKLLPIHVRVAEWVVTTEWTIFMGGVLGGWTNTRVLDGGEFDDLGVSGAVLVSLEHRGDLGAPANKQTMTLTDGAGAPLVPAVNTGIVPALPLADPDVWYPVAGFTDRDITDSVASAVPPSWRAVATATAGVTIGEVRWTFRVTRGTLGS